MSGGVEDIFLFVNPKSGGNKGEEFLQIKPNPLPLELHGGRKGLLHIFSLIEGKAHDKCGFHKLRETIAKKPPGNRVKVVVGGGDGTIMWADTEATAHGIDTQRQVAYGVVPLGTGNDFSRVAGWGGKNPYDILEDDYAQIRSLARCWDEARPRPHDVWQVDIIVNSQHGEIRQVNSEKEESALVEDGDDSVKKVKLSNSMINYFDVGQVSKVGMEFDKHRTKSQTCNLFVYAFEGAWTEMQCISVQHVGSLVAALYEGTGPDGRVLMSSSPDHADAPELVGNPECLMFLNVNSYAGGFAKFWQPSLSRYAVEPRPAEEEVDVENNPGDQRLEAITLPALVDVPVDKVMHVGRRLHSGGPYFLEFWAIEDEDVHAYIEVDGEFYHLVNPESITIKLNKTIQVIQHNFDSDSEDSD